MYTEKAAGSGIIKKVRQSFATDQVFIGNEYHTNILIAKIMLMMTGMLWISWLLNSVGIYSIDASTMNGVVLQGSAELIIPAVVCLALKGKKNWLKYLMMLEFVAVFARIDGVLTYSVVPVMFVPIVLACCYYSGMFTVMVSVWTVILFAVASFYSAYFEVGIIDLNFYTADKAEYVKNIMQQSFLPKLFNYILVTVICYIISVRCRRMMIQQHTISEEHTRVATELDLASRIQKQALPIVRELPKQDVRTFDLAATMVPAKAIGGDFYDFFYIDPTHLVLMIADVSGKGVPAALFMMVSKILLDNSFDNDRSPAHVLTEVNHQLCQKQLESMFVTVWLGVLDLETGELVTASAGHEYPVIAKAGEKFELIKEKHGFVLGGLDGVRYKNVVYQLNPGDVLFVYTDGVPEANNLEDKQFGLDRMLDSLNAHRELGMEELLSKVKEDINRFTDGASPFDDTTMMALRFERNFVREGITIKPSKENLTKVMDYVDEQMEKHGIDMKKSHKVGLVVDELFANIIEYSGAEWAQLIIRCEENAIRLYIRDNGMPYNPLEAKEPDVKTAAEERQIGGLGIFLCRKITDEMKYRYINGVNIVSAVINK